MRVLTLNELMRLTRIELCDLVAQMANILRIYPEGSAEREAAIGWVWRRVSRLEHPGALRRRTDGGNDGWAGSRSQGRQPPKAVAAGQPLLRLPAQPNSSRRIETCVRVA